jgi:hypothetical protein
MSNWAANALVSQLFPMMMGWIGPGGTFAIVSVFVVCAIVFVKGCLPETKNLTLEQVETLFSDVSDSWWNPSGLRSAAASAGSAEEPLLD